jgi:hypothetical protein
MPTRVTGVVALYADDGSWGKTHHGKSEAVSSGSQLISAVRCSQDWDKANTLASEVVEEYNSATRLVYIKGTPG